MPVKTMAQRFPTKDFRIELIRHDLNQREIARYLGVHPSMVSQVVNNFWSTAWVYDFLLLILREMQAGTFTRLSDYDYDRPA